MNDQEMQAIFMQQKENCHNMAKTTAKDRKKKLSQLKEAILRWKSTIESALEKDLRRNPMDTEFLEIHPCLGEISFAIRHLSQWMKPKKVKTPIFLMGTKSEVRYEPKGVILIISPWNYPFQLAIAPLVAAIAGGNCAILKPSELSPHTSQVLHDLLAEVFPNNEVCVCLGTVATAQTLLEKPFDHIFFTGGTSIASKIMEAGAKNLASLTLELGGKSPVIVDQTSPSAVAGERIAWGKFINAGQTCVAPDYIWVEESKQASLIAEIKKSVQRFYGETEEQRQKSPDYCRIIHQKHFTRLQKIFEDSVKLGAKVEMGGVFLEQDNYISPTILSNITLDSPIMKSEIFGPILPVLTFRNLEEPLSYIRKKDKPLALYIFSANTMTIEKILHETTAGGTCINNVILHLANPYLPFGGVGASGQGKYHGFYGFAEFSHLRAIMRQSRFSGVSLLYPPYTEKVKKLVRWFGKLF